MIYRLLKNFFICLLFLFLLIETSFAQIVWLETSQSDFADGHIDQSLYISHRSYIEGVNGAVEWTPRFDFDLNGYPDLVSSDYNYGVRDIRVWYMNASGLDSSKYLTFYDAGAANDVADLNCDGYPELVQSGFGWDNVLIFWNNSGAFSDSDTSMLGPHSTGEGIYIADYDKDGYLDIAITGEDDFRIYWGDSGGIHGWQSLTNTVFDIEYGTHFSVEAADIDNDGDLDIMAVYGRTTDGPLYIFRNNGSRIFTVDSIFLSTGSDRRHGISVGDIDNDGNIDIVSTGFWTSSADIANVLLNDGTGHFTTDIPIHPGSCHGGSNIYDFNGDGWLDILFFDGHPAEYLKIYENTGAIPYFSDASSYSVGPFPVDASGGMVIDVNNDGYVDIYIDNMETQSYLFYGPDFSSYESFPVNQDHHGMFRNPGNILNKTKTAFYESSIFDAGDSICSGIVSWDAYDERDYSGGTLPIPTGSQIIILGRSGDTSIPDVSWTEWDTLTDDSPLPASIIGNRYFQYRAELWYSNPAYLPWLEQIEFDFTLCSEDTIATIDSVWFFEETDCNDSNIVEICYILSGDTSSNISIQISPDSGATWVDFGEDWFITFEDTAGDIGDSILPGIHCFEWFMSTDFPDTEGMDWVVNVSTISDEEECSDSFVWEIVDTIISPMGSNQDMTTTPWSVIGVSDGAPGSNINLYEYDKCTGELMRTVNIPVPYSSPGQGITYAFGYLWVCEHHNHIFQISYETMTLVNTYSLALSGISITP
ncbi:VCBS repeat-containing protein [bacterium]|nr:VCBS repeat-containing protein [bacterium]